MIKETASLKINELIKYLRDNQDLNQYVSKEISVYDYSMIISDLEQIRNDYFDEDDKC